MKVEILKETKRVKGGVGKVVKCDAALGNELAGWGVVRVVEHDKPGNKPAGVVEETEPQQKDEHGTDKARLTGDA